MKVECLALASREPDPVRRLNVLREYVQAMVLFSLHQSEAFANISFVGGTALRFLFRLPRFSEDLDFSLEMKPGYLPEKWLQKIKRDLSLMGFEADITWNDERTVHTGWLKIAGLLKEAGVAPLASQKLSIKLEIDSRPPKGARTEVEVVQIHRMMALRHHTLPCLMAGKIRAILTRPYAKGRDWYDLLWYLSRIPPTHPDLKFLQASLGHGATEKIPDAVRWRELLAERLGKIDTKALRKDVSPFLERPDEEALLQTDYLRKAIRSE